MAPRGGHWTRGLVGLEASVLQGRIATRVFRHQDIRPDGSTFWNCRFWNSYKFLPVSTLQCSRNSSNADPSQNGCGHSEIQRCQHSSFDSPTIRLGCYHHLLELLARRYEHMVHQNPSMYLAKAFYRPHWRALLPHHNPPLLRSVCLHSCSCDHKDRPKIRSNDAHGPRCLHRLRRGISLDQ
jgi:hypothetical protein